jgi:uncharacterized repeat protein (TIGR01451 family)
VTCDAGTLAVGASVSYTVTVTVNPGVRNVVIPNCAQDSTTTADPILANNQACVDTAVSLVNPPHSTIQVVKHGPAVVRPGGTFSYTVDVTNLGPDPAAAVVVTDPVASPPLTVTSLPAGCDLRGSTVACLVGGLTVGQTKTLTFTVTVAASAVPGTMITNCAAAGSVSGLLTRELNQACVQTVVLPTRQALLSITKSAPDQARPGQTITYTLSVTNHGPNAAADVTIKDPIQNTSLGTITSLPPGCTLASGTVTCDLGTLAPGETKTLSVQVRVGSGVPDATVIGNCAAVYSTTSSPDLDNAQSCVITLVRVPSFFPVTG